MEEYVTGGGLGGFKAFVPFPVSTLLPFHSSRCKLSATPAGTPSLCCHER